MYKVHKVWVKKKVSKFQWKIYFTKTCPIYGSNIHNFWIRVSGKKGQLFQPNRTTFCKIKPTMFENGSTIYLFSNFET